MKNANDVEAEFRKINFEAERPTRIARVLNRVVEIVIFLGQKRLLIECLVRGGHT